MVTKKVDEADGRDEPRRTATSVDEQWREKVEACAARIESELGSQWMNEKGNEAAHAAAKMVRELLA